MGPAVVGCKETSRLMPLLYSLLTRWTVPLKYAVCKILHGVTTAKGYFPPSYVPAYSVGGGVSSLYIFSGALYNVGTCIHTYTDRPDMSGLSVFCM